MSADQGAASGDVHPVGGADGINGGNCICTGLVTGPGDGLRILPVTVDLGDDRQLDLLLQGSQQLHQIRRLGITVNQLDHVGAGVLHHVGHLQRLVQTAVAVNTGNQSLDAQILGTLDFIVSPPGHGHIGAALVVQQAHVPVGYHVASGVHRTLDGDGFGHHCAAASFSAGCQRFGIPAARAGAKHKGSVQFSSAEHRFQISHSLFSLYTVF